MISCWIHYLYSCLFWAIEKQLQSNSSPLQERCSYIHSIFSAIHHPLKGLSSTRCPPSQRHLSCKTYLYYKNRAYMYIYKWNTSDIVLIYYFICYPLNCIIIIVLESYLDQCWLSFKSFPHYFLLSPYHNMKMEK